MDLKFPKLRIALSDCLQGRECRYDGGHAQDFFVKQQLSKYADYYAFCPESAVIGTPRETINLILISDQIEVIGSQTGTDYKDALQAYSDLKINYFKTQKLDGAVVKSRSPSCGLEDVKLYDEFGEWKLSPVEPARGLFTQSLQTQHPNIAIEDERRLQDAWLREQFLIQAFALARWRYFMEMSPSRADFQSFHQSAKYLLLAKNERMFRSMGEIVIQSNADNLELSLFNYQQAYLSIMASQMTRGEVVDAFDYMLGYFNSQLSEDDKAIYSEAVSAFRQGLGNLISLASVTQDFIKRHGSETLQSQLLLQPYPADLALVSNR